jgi:hypothetical protein
MRTVAKIVQRDDTETRLYQFDAGMRTDIAGCTGNKNFFRHAMINLIEQSELDDSQRMHDIPARPLF